MRGLRLPGGRVDRAVQIDVVERAAPVPRGDEVALEIEACWLPLDVSGDRVAGIAVVGRGIAAGDGGGQLVGRRALACSALGCGDCEVCRRGGVAACPAGGVLGRDPSGPAAAAYPAGNPFEVGPLEVAEVMLARARWLCPLEDGLTLDAVSGAMVAGPAALAYSMYARAGMAPGQPVVALGHGPVARLVARVAEARGGRVVRAAPDGDPAAIERELAAIVAGEGRPRMIFDAGEPGGLALAARLAQAGSVLVLLARAGQAPIDLAPLIARHVTVIGVAGPHPDLLPELAALVVRGEVAVADLAEVVAWSSGSIASANERAAAAGRALVLTR